MTTTNTDTVLDTNPGTRIDASTLQGAVLAKLPYNRSNGCDVNAVVDQLTGRV